MRQGAIRRIAGRNIRDRRKSLDWSCAELGRKVGLTRGGISAIELGRVSPSLDTYGRIALALGVQPEQLLTAPNGQRAIRPVARRTAS